MLPGVMSERRVGDGDPEIAQQDRRPESTPRQSLHAHQQHRRLGQDRQGPRQYQRTGRIASATTDCICCRSAGLDSRSASARPPVRPAQNPTAAPKFNPIQEASVAAQVGN